VTGQEDCAHLVLVVDDDRDIRESLADLLGDEGYRVVTASDGQEALEILRQLDGQPCVILLDLMMPIMSGAELHAEMAADPKLATIPVVVISADASVKQKAAALGSEYLAKPMHFDRVLHAVERYCNA
jgi:CheY-like chemotaxis protein